MNQSPTPNSPPNWIIRFLEWFCPEELIEAILGDLLEEYESDKTLFSTKKANLRFIRNVLRFFHPSIILRNHLTINFMNMGILKNYLKIALRTFWRQKLTTSINIIGLTLGIACASLSFVFVQYELSFDKFHEEHENIYWLSTTIQQKINLSVTPCPLAPELVNHFPEITDGFRLQNQKIMIADGNDFFKEEILFVDSNFFSFFNFSLLEGNENQSLQGANSLMLSEEKAKKYFGDSNPMGKTMSLYFGEEREDFLITGILENSPKNSSIQASFLLPIQWAYKNDKAILTSDWKKFQVTSFIRLKEKKDFTNLKEKLITFIESKYEGDQAEYTFLLHAFDDYHLKDNFTANGLTNPAEMSYVKILGVIGLLILMIACLNFMNLSNAKSSKRLTEVGVRKVMGAKPRQLRHQFLSESILTSLFSLAVAIFLIESLLPYISQITGYNLVFNWLKPSTFLPLLGITLIAGILAGIYPSLLLSNLKPVNTFKSNLKIGGNNLATKGSLIFQFALSIGLLSCTFIMYQQQQFIKSKNLGFNQEQIVVIPLQTDYSEGPLAERLVQQFRQELNQLTDVKTVSAVNHSFNRGNLVQFVETEDEPMIFVYDYRVDPAYIPMLGIEIKEGNNFSLESATEGHPREIIVNEAFLKKFEIDHIEGYQLPKKFEKYAGATIIGVVKDYHYQDLRQAIRPMLLHVAHGVYGNVLAKINTPNLEHTLAELKESWKKIRPNKPFEFSFMDEDIQRQYIAEERWNKVISGASALAILISCLGLFGLIALTLAERTKELGVRKILGASFFNINWLIAKQFILLLIIAALLAIPLVVYGMQIWLRNFAYQIEIQWLVILLAILLTTFLALLTTGIQSIKAALQNPADALRFE